VLRVVKFKLDENLGIRTQNIFRAAGHDASTVDGQQLCGCTDDRLFEVCRTEGRCLVTLDLDFGDVTRFPPERAAGVAVLRLPRNPSLPVLESLVDSFLRSLETTQLVGRLWIVEPGRIRIHQTEEPELGG
jgi:predicted nuclease of predicted toxin-antitoxin system